MTMIPTRHDFTSNDELDTLNPGDPTIAIMGYVDVIEGLKMVGKPKRAIYKFVINNAQGRRVRIVLWEDKATLYEPVIIHREIICIKRAKVVPIKEEHFKPGDNIIPFEITVQNTTSIELLGPFYLGGIQDPTIYKKIKISETADSSGAICVEGYITLPFEFEMLGYSSCGTGAITDGTHKLRIQITQLDVDNGMCKGVHVRVQGILKKDSLVGVYLLVQNMNNVTIIHGN